MYIILQYINLRIYIYTYVQGVYIDISYICIYIYMQSEMACLHVQPIHIFQQPNNGKTWPGCLGSMAIGLVHLFEAFRVVFREASSMSTFLK